MVNRIWLHLFGRGIVPTPDDFGPMGQLPSHPKLLDWLANDFAQNGWSIKRTIRSIVLSETYGQAAQANPQLSQEKISQIDPDNILLHRMPVRRLQAEAIRDSLLAVSGRINLHAFGPGVPTHRTAFMTGRGSRPSGPWMGMAEEVYTRQSTGISSILFFWPSICPVLLVPREEGEIQMCRLSLLL